MDPNKQLAHLVIYVYDDGPPPAEPCRVSMCQSGRGVGALLVDENAQVTCPACLGYMRELLL